MAGIFEELVANRKHNSQLYGVYGHKVNGKLRQSPSVTELTLEYAERTAKRMEELNPGKKFVVKPL